MVEKRSFELNCSICSTALVIEMDFERSNNLFTKEALNSLVGGVNSPVRAFRSVNMPSPLFIERGQGSRIWDVDGNSFIDYVGAWGPLILGHAHPEVVASVQEQLQRGSIYGAPFYKEVQLAEKIKQAVSSIDLIRFVNSGTEAALGVLRLARGYTGRDKVIKFEGCYHGSVDSLLIKAGSGATTLSMPDSKGVTSATAQDTLLAQFNNFDSVRQLCEEHYGEVAAIIVEPIAGNMGLVAPELSFLTNLRALCDREGILLIFDEVMTGFRVAWGGAQSLFEVLPDLCMLGKIIGGGLPVGAFGGAKHIMNHLAPLGEVYQAGTYAGCALAMQSGLTTLEIIERDDVIVDLNRNLNLILDEIKHGASQQGIPVQTNSFGAMGGVFFTGKPVRNYADALATDTQSFVKFFRRLLAEGIYIAPSAYEAWFISTAHSDADIDQTCSAIQSVFREW